jgi:F-type H+-transporting ATPase subunit O
LPPSVEDTIEGRYAGVLFSCASREEALYKVYEDMRYIELLYKNSESFKLFTENAGVGSTQIRQFTDALVEVAGIQPVTVRFIEVLQENKKLMYVKEIAQRYQKFYAQFNREEKITIISAAPLSKEQEGQVLAALKANPENAGKDFQLEFTVDGSIMGGL